MKEKYDVIYVINQGEDLFYFKGCFFKKLASIRYIEGEELCEGDKLIEQRDMIAVKSWFEENISQHSLKILTAL